MDTIASRKSKSQGRVTSQSRARSSEFVPISSRRNFKHRTSGSMSERKSDSSNDTMSDTDHELDAFGSDVEYDEETGLATEERRKHLREQRRQKKLSERIAGNHGPISNEDSREADKYVAKRLMINAVLVGLWYFFSLSISIYNKWMFSPENLDFHFPLFTTSFHMIVQFILATSVLAIFPSLRPKLPPPAVHEPLSTPSKPLLTPLFYFTRLVPTGAATSLDIGLGNTSLRYITLTFYTMCKSSVLIWVLVFAFLFRLEAASLRLILIIVSMTIGVLMMAFGETAFNALGFALAISASFFSGFRWALTQILLLRHPATSNPFATLFLLAPIMFVTLFTIALFSETPSSIIDGLSLLQEREGTARAALLMFIPGILAFCMIAAEFTLLQRTNVVTLSICGIFKEVVTISAAGVIFHDKLSVVNVSGLVITIICIACYNYLKVTKMREEAREKLAKKLDDLDDNGDINRNSRKPSRVIGAGPTMDDNDGDNPLSRSTDGANVPLMNGEAESSTSRFHR